VVLVKESWLNSSPEVQDVPSGVRRVDGLAAEPPSLGADQGGASNTAAPGAGRSVGAWLVLAAAGERQIGAGRAGGLHQRTAFASGRDWWLIWAGG
jgi:hypothetical protein